MKKILSVPNKRSRALVCVCVSGLFFAALSPVSAEEQSLKDGAKRAGHATGSIARDIGQGAKRVGKEIGQGAKKVGKEIGGAAKEGGREFRRAVKGQ